MATSKPVPPSAGSPDMVVGEESESARILRLQSFNPAPWVLRYLCKMHDLRKKTGR